MVDPTPIKFGYRPGKPSRISVQDFIDAFRDHLCSTTGISFDGLDPIEDDLNKYPEGEIPIDINMAVYRVSRFCEIYVYECIASSTGHFSMDINNDTEEALKHLNELIKAGHSSVKEPYTRETFQLLIEDCLKKTSVDLLKTNIFPAPAIQR